MKPTLVILAAGMGSRYGGLKQLDEVGPNGEAIIDYSLFDAIRAGFGKVVFIIRHDFEEAFKERFDKKLKGKIEVEYAFQNLDDIPEPFKLPEGRVKPWGTGHAIRAARFAVCEPFAAINADDFYGFDAYKTVVDFLTTEVNPTHYSMVGYKLNNTLSENGSVSRGICSTDSKGNLMDIVENTKILPEEGKIISYLNSSKIELTGSETVSMNFWGFHQSLFRHLEEEFINFLGEQINVEKSEFYIPFVVHSLIKQHKVTSKVITCNASWFGVTYKEDKPVVIDRVRKLIEDGEYPSKLW